jgi:hypothetical protein
MANQLKVLFVEMVKAACLANPEGTVLGWDHDFEIETIDLLPADAAGESAYVTVKRNDDGSWSEVTANGTPFMFKVRYWNEYGDGEDSPCHPEKTLGMCEVVTEVGKLIAGQADLDKALDAMRVIRGDLYEVGKVVSIEEALEIMKARQTSNAQEAQ